MRHLALAAVGAAVAFAPATRGQATFSGMGDLPGGSFNSQVYGLSPDGLTATGRATPGGYDPFVWTRADGMQGLGAPNDPYNVSSGSDISGGEPVIVGTAHVGNNQVAYRWSAGEGFRFDLGRLHDAAPTNSFGNAVSGDGLVIVGRARGNPDFGTVFEAYRWTAAEGMTGLGFLTEDLYQAQSAARATTFDGSVIVGETYTDAEQYADREAFYWTAQTGMVGLGDLAGDLFASVAWAVTPDGAVVVGVGNYDEYDLTGEAFRWTAQTGMVGLGTLPGHGVSSAASAVTADGSTIFGKSPLTAPNHRAFIWRQETGMLPLADVLTGEYGLDLGGWILESVSAVSDDGLTIVGNGTNPAGQTEAWIVTLPPLCSADLDGSGTLDLFDFLTFTNLFNAGDPKANCDANQSLDLFDFLCFVNAFNAGC